MQKCFVFILILGLGLTDLNAQSLGEKSELGFILGGSYYTGELNRMGHFRQVSPAAGIIYRYNVNPRLALRGSVFGGHIKGDDSKSRHAFDQNRNLSFRSPVVEGAFGVEFNYMNYATGRLFGERYWCTPYMIVQLSVFYFNPQAELNGQWYELQPLGTEGQGTSLSNRSTYSRVQVSMPLGLGFKFNIHKKVQVSLEYGMRLTFTDYLDDVRGSYVDPIELAAINGSIAASLSDRSLNQVGSSGRNVGSRRGDGAFRDWYSFFGIGITFKLGQRSECEWSDQ
jgi:hypothetical protein